MTGKYDPKALFQPAVMQPLASVLFKPSDFTSLEDHAARRDGRVVNTPPLAIVDDTPRMHDDDQDTNLLMPTHGYMTLAEALPSGPHLWSPQMGPDAHAFREAIQLGEAPYGCCCYMLSDNQGGYYQLHSGADWLKLNEWLPANRPTLAPGVPGCEALWMIFPYKMSKRHFRRIFGAPKIQE